MKYITNFLNTKDSSKTLIFKQLKCSKKEADILQYILKQYTLGSDTIMVVDVLSELYNTTKYAHLKELSSIKNILELGWIVQTSFGQFKLSSASTLELLNTPISLSHAFLQILEAGTLDINLPQNEPYTDHLEYIQDQFTRIELYQKYSTLKQNHNNQSPSVQRVQTKLTLLESRINERRDKTTISIDIENFFSDNSLDEKEQIIFLALLKEEYSTSDENLRDMNTLIEMVSHDEYERIKNRKILEDSSKLIKEGFIDYDEMLMPFGGITKNFYITINTMSSLSNTKTAKKEKIKLDTLIRDEGMFELIESKSDLGDVVLHPSTRELLDNLLAQTDRKVVTRLKEWGIREKKSGIDAKILLYGPPGTGKTLTSYSLGKSLKKPILSFDCSKILSMYVGESEKNVRKIFDDFRDFSAKTKTQPILLLNEADQFLSSRTTGGVSGSDKMHNQMQNIFLEQIEKFDGVLIANTNLLENIDPAFSRRFNYKIEFKKPDESQRVKLWQLMLPESADYEEDFNIEELASYHLTGGQISLIMKNTAYKVAIKDEPIFSMSDFIDEINRERKGNFTDAKQMGFLNKD